VFSFTRSCTDLPSLEGGWPISSTLSTLPSSAPYCSDSRRIVPVSRVPLASSLCSACSCIFAGQQCSVPVLIVCLVSRNNAHASHRASNRGPRISAAPWIRLLPGPDPPDRVRHLRLGLPSAVSPSHAGGPRRTRFKLFACSLGSPTAVSPSANLLIAPAGLRLLCRVAPLRPIHRQPCMSHDYHKS
jgi:hypothetical protein